MKKTEFITKMLELGAELEKAETGMKCNMIVNDANILYDKHLASQPANGVDKSTGNCNKHIVNGSALKPPIGLMPKDIYERNSKIERFNDVCWAIARYYDAGLPIKIEWINEYNEYVSSVGEHCR